MAAPLMILDRGATFVVRGNAWPVLTAIGLKPFYVGGTAMGFIVDGHHLAHVCAYLESQGRPYQIRRGDT